MVPQNLRHLFWDTNVASFDPTAYPHYTITRVLEFGDERAVAWLKSTFPEEEIRRVILRERRLSARSANFWALAYGIPLNEVAALKPAR